MKQSFTRHFWKTGALVSVLLLVNTVQAQDKSTNRIAQIIYPVAEFGSQIPELERKLDLNIKDTSISEALFIISTRANLEIAFDSRVFHGGDTKITLDKKNISVADALIYILEGTGYEAVMTEKGEIILKRIDEGEHLFNHEVRGTVTDAQTGEPLPGVTVVVSGSDIGTATDEDGYYEFSVPSEEETLRFSYIGYQTREIPVNGQTEITVTLRQDVIAGDEIIVTAFGLERERRGLSYSIQEIQGESVSRAGGSTDLLSGLQGKVAGVIVRQSSGVPGERPQMTIRGSRSLTGNNEPLYVVDGMPIDGSRPIDIHPGDIESLNVLKGPSAAALYGLRASNGAIVITTRRGASSDGRPVITFNTNFSLDRLSVWPDVQQTYMQGTPEGGYEPNSAFSWGPRIDEMGTYINQMGEQVQARAYDNVGAFFQTGYTWNNNLNIGNRFENGNYSVSLGLTDQEGIVPTSYYQRVNIKAAGEYNLTDRLQVGTSLNYTKGDRDTFFYTGGGNSSVFYAAFWAPVSYDYAGFPTHVEGEPYNQINFRGQHDNIYWLLENNRETSERDRFFGNLHTRYELVDWISLNYRIGLDTYNESEKTVLALGSGATGGRTNPPSGGSINDRLFVYQQLNSNASLQMSRAFGDGHFEVDLLLGNEINDINSRTVTASGSGIVIGGFNHISNTITTSTGESVGRSRVVGFFGDLSVSWQNTLYLTLTGRNDVVSNMPRGNRTFFYPSAGLGFVFTELMKISEDVLTFGKLRASVAEVGQAGPTFSTQNVFVPGGGGGFAFPYGGVRGFTLSSNLNSSDLKPENTRTVELGFDLRFLNARLGIDYTYYNTTSKGQIFRVPVPVSTGFSSELRNAGEMNTKGHEIILSLRPVQTTSFAWDFLANFTTYDNRVISLAEGITQLSLGGSYVDIVAEEGEPYPIIRGPGYARDPVTGEVVVDSRETLPNGQPNPHLGFPLRATENVNLGKVYPDFEVGFLNTLTFRNFSMNVQIDWRSGGNVSSGTNRLGDLYGASAKTEHRDKDYIWPGKKGYFESDGTLVVEGNNDLVIRRNRTYHQYIDPIRESIVYDASYVRLREITLMYDLPQTILGRTFLSEANVFVTASNFLLYSNLPNADPEMNWRNPTGNFQGEENLTYPLSKSISAGFRLRF